MPRVVLAGGAYSAASLIANAQRSVNLFPEINPKTSSAPVPVTHYPRPGLTPLGAPPAPGQGRCLYGATNGDLYCVVDQQVYYIDPDFNYHNIGALETPAETPAYMADNGFDIALVDGTAQGYDIKMSSRAFSTIGDPNFLGADRNDYIDSFLIFNQPGTPNWYSSLSNSVSFNALDFGTKTAWPDNIIAIIACERVVWLLGPKKGEVWYNAGTSPFSFSEQPSIIIEQGCAAKYSVQKQDVNIYWLSQSPEGDRMVMRGNNNLAQRISFSSIEAEFRRYPRVDDAVGDCYQIQGHAFYRLHFPTADKTWVWDENTQQWWEDNSIDKNGNLHRSKIAFTAFAYGMNIGLDWQTGQIYKIDPSNFTDNGNPMPCIRSFPHMLDEEDDRTTYWRFMADMECGTGPGTQQIPTANSPWSLGFSNGFGPATITEPPLVSLRTSRTRGESWGNPVMQPMGAAGRYNNRPTWNRLGYATDMVFELSWSTPMKTALNGAFVVFERHEGDN